MGADPLGGASVQYWEPIKAVYDLDITLVNCSLDPLFSFMTLDHDGKIRMDCSNPYAMASLVKLKDQFDIAFANDTDADRHGIVTRSLGLMMKALPVAIATPDIHSGIIAGKLNGVMPAPMPIGWRIE